MKHRVPAVLAASLFVGACSADLPTATPVVSRASASANASTNGQGGNGAPTRYIVVFQPGVRNPRGMTEELTRAFGVTPTYTYTAALQGFAAELPPAALDGISRNPNVLYIEPDAQASIVGSGTRTLSSGQWGLDRLDQQADRTRDNRYSYQNEGDGVEVYILDTGIRYSHQEFGGRALSLYDYVEGDAVAQECQGHGTHVAGTVGGATVGVASKVKLYGVRVLGCDGSGSYSSIIAAIDSVTKRKLATPNVPMVGNMSLGGQGIYQPVIDAVERSVASGVVWAIAAGNSSMDACSYSPAAAPSALTVAASTSTDARASFSNYGSCTDLFAPGAAILSSVKTSDTSYESWNGTSMASPHVAGVAALYLSANPTATALQVNGALTSGATAGVIGDALGSPNRLLYSLIAGASVTPPPPPPLVSVHAGDLEGSAFASGKNNWSATFSVLVHDAAEAPVANATVSITWSGAQSGSGSCLTSSTGRCTITRSSLGRNTSAITFRVGGVSKSGTQYVATSNHDVNGNSDGTSLTIVR